MKSDDNPMAFTGNVLRCTATSRRSGSRCRGPAVKGWTVCYYHGAGGGHPAGREHPSWKHGMRSREWLEERRELNELVRKTRAIERLV